jgi:uncharacterized membrane protein
MFVDIRRRPRPERREDHDEQGYVVVFFALLLIPLLIVAGIVVDLGNARQQRQRAQSVADSAALAGAQGISDQPKDPVTQAFAYAFKSLVGDPSPAGTQTSCGSNCQSYTASGYTVQVTTPWQSDPSMVHDQLCFTVPISLSAAFSSSPTKVCASATAEYVVPAGAGGFWLGSYAADITAPTFDAGLANSALGGLAKTGSPLNISLIGYQGLAATNVDLGTLAVDGGFGTVDSLVNAKVSNANFAIAVINAVNNASPGTLVSADVAAIKLALGNGGAFTVGQYLRFAQGTNGNAGSVVVNMADLFFGSLTGAAYLANGSNALSVPAANLNVLGLANAGLTLNVIQPAQHYTGPVGGPTCPNPVPPATTANLCTAQISGTLNGTLNDINLGNNTEVNLSLSIPISGADASALLTSVNCAAQKFTVAVTTAGLSFNPITIGFTIKVLGIPVPVNLTASWTQAGGFANLTFQAPFSPPTVYTVSNGAFGPLTINLGGLGIGLPGGTVSAITNALQPVLANVTQKLAPSLGLNGPGATVWNDTPGPSCGNAILSLNQ